MCLLLLLHIACLFCRLTVHRRPFWLILHAVKQSSNYVLNDYHKSWPFFVNRRLFCAIVDLSEEEGEEEGSACDVVTWVLNSCMNPRFSLVADAALDANLARWAREKIFFHFLESSVKKLCQPQRIELCDNEVLQEPTESRRHL